MELKEESNYKAIPTEVTIGGQHLNVENIPTITDDRLGQCSVAEGYIRIAETFNGKIHSDSSKRNTFYHEVTHCILDTMGEFELSANEKFVSCFSAFLTEAMRKAVFKE